MRTFGSVCFFLFLLGNMVVLDGCESTRQILHPYQEKLKSEKKAQQHQDKVKDWLATSEPQKKLSLTLSNWRSYPFPKNSVYSYRVESNLHRLRRLYIPLNSHQRPTKQYIYYIANFNPINKNGCQEMAEKSKVGETFCPGKKESSISKKSNGILSKSYYYQCQPDVFKKTYMTNYHCGKVAPGPLIRLLGQDSGGNICYFDKDGQGPYPTQDAANIANKAIEKAKSQPSIKLMLYRRCFYDTQGTYYIEYLAEKNKENEDQASSLFNSIRFNPSKIDGSM